MKRKTNIDQPNTRLGSTKTKYSKNDRLDQSTAKANDAKNKIYKEHMITICNENQIKY